MSVKIAVIMMIRYPPLAGRDNPGFPFETAAPVASLVRLPPGGNKSLLSHKPQGRRELFCPVKKCQTMPDLTATTRKLHEDTMRLLHTMLRVGNLQRAIDFYTRILGMTLLRTSENPQYKYTLAFLGYGPEHSNSVLELTWNWETTSYDLGNAYGHMAISVENASLACEHIRQHGGKVIREAGPVKGGSTVIAFIEDPDGYKIELIEDRHAGKGLEG